MLLRAKLDELLVKTARPLVIFDLDGTLLDVVHRTAEILRRFSAQSEIVRRFPEQLAVIARLKHDEYLYGLQQTLNSIGLSSESEHAARFLHAAKSFWLKHFFTDEMVLFDRPYPGAVECARHFYDAGAMLVYLSGRDVPNMSKGTIESLEKHGFPHSGHRVSIHLKPAYGQDDLLFKRQALETIRASGEVIATFDNEPANVQMFIESFPRAMNFHFKTQYARHIDLNGPSFHVISEFRELGFR